MTATRNGLRELEGKIKGLPVQEALQRQRQLLRSTRENVRQRESELKAGIGQLNALRTMQADQSLLASAEQKALATAKSKAQELLNLLAQADQDNNQVSMRLEAVTRAARGLSDAVKANWVQACQVHRERAEALKSLAQQLSPNLLACIGELERLLQANDAVPPADPATVQAIVTARSALDAQVAALEMNGPVETFLRHAQNGNGDPQALLDPQIRAYLDANPALWKSLRVVLD